MKTIFLNNWIYYVMSGILIIVFTAGEALLIYFEVLDGIFSSGGVAGDYLMYIIFMPVIIFIAYPLCIYILIKNFFQWTYIDKDKIISRSVFGVIRKVMWTDVEKVIEADVNFSSPGSTMHWFCIVDKLEDSKMSNGVARKNSYIMIRRTKKNRKALEYYWGKEIETMI